MFSPSKDSQSAKYFHYRKDTQWPWFGGINFLWGENNAAITWAILCSTNYNIVIVFLQQWQMVQNNYHWIAKNAVKSNWWFNSNSVPFRLTVKHFGTSLADNFCIPNCWRLLSTMRLLCISNASAILLVEICQLSHERYQQFQELMPWKKAFHIMPHLEF